MRITDISYFQGSNEEIAMKSDIYEVEYLAAKGAAGIIFRGNSAVEGGAIANNGFVEAGYKSGLTVEKRVTGEGAPSGDSFVFTVTFSDGKTYDGVASGSSFLLKDGERKLISNIPQAIRATVTEQAKANYTALEYIQSATIGEYGSELIFVNNCSAPPPPPPTGDSTNLPLLIALLAGSVIALALTLISKRKHSEF